MTRYVIRKWGGTGWQYLTEGWTWRRVGSAQRAEGDTRSNYVANANWTRDVHRAEIATQKRRAQVVARAVSGQVATLERAMRSVL